MAKVLFCKVGEKAKLVDVGSEFIPTATKALLGGRTKLHWLGGQYWVVNLLENQQEADESKLTMETDTKKIYGDAIIYKIDRRMNPKGLTKAEVAELLG